MLLRHADVRAAAKDWQTFSSDAPFRVPIPSEEEMRTMRQLPIEVNPPQHAEYRKIVEPFFKRAKQPDTIAKVHKLTSELLHLALSKNSIEVVSQLALPIQSHALTYLLNVPESEAEIYIDWGIHVFSGKGTSLEDYLSSALDRAASQPSDDFFSALTQAQFQGRPLTRQEMMGFANLTFAGGRDTIIHSISSIIHHLAKHPHHLEALRSDPKGIILAGEEFFRAFTPLTHIGRICPAATQLQGHHIPADGRISLGWAAANFDPEVFPSPEKIQLDRKPNPHVSFGFGTHLCLGAAHARLIIRTLLEVLASQVSSIKIIQDRPHLEHNPSYQRENGFDHLEASFLNT